MPSRAWSLALVVLWSAYLGQPGEHFSEWLDEREASAEKVTLEEPPLQSWSDLEDYAMAATRWTRVYLKTGEGKGIICLLVTKFTNSPGEKRWVVVCPNGRLQVVDLDSQQVRLKPFPRTDHGTFMGLTPKEKTDVLAGADRLVLEQDASKAFQVKRGPPPAGVRGKPRAGRRGGGFGERMFWWGFNGASDVVSYFFLRRGFGTVLSGLFATWRISRATGAWEWISWSYGRIKDTVETVEDAREQWELLVEMHEEGKLELVYISAGIVVFVLWTLCCVRGRGSSTPSPYSTTGVPTPPTRSLWERLTDPFSRSSSAVSTPRDDGLDASDTEDQPDPVLQRLNEVADRLSALETKKETPSTGSAAAAAPTSSTQATWGSDSYDTMMGRLMQRLDHHRDLMMKDSGLGVDGPLGAPRAGGGLSGHPPTAGRAQEVPNEIEGLLKGLEDSFKDMRAVAKEKLEAYQEEVPWALVGSIKTRVAPRMIARIYKSGGTAVQMAKEFIRAKELDGNHLADEMMMVAMLIDRSLIEAPPEWVNYKTTEIAFRRMHAIERAFELVRGAHDWRPPKQPKGWKSKVNYLVLSELDPLKSTEEDVLIEGVEKELRERLAQKALLQKTLDKLGDPKPPPE